MKIFVSLYAKHFYMNKLDYYIEQIKSRYGIDITAQDVDESRIERLKKAIDAEDQSKEKFNKLSDKEKAAYIASKRKLQERIDSESGN